MGDKRRELCHWNAIGMQYFWQGWSGDTYSLCKACSQFSTPCKYPGQDFLRTVAVWGGGALSAFHPKPYVSRSGSFGIKSFGFRNKRVCMVQRNFIRFGAMGKLGGDLSQCPP